MTLLGFLFRNKKKEDVPWEETKAGKVFYEKSLQEAIKRKEEKEEWERNTPPDRKEQVKYFKIIITIFTLGFAAAVYVGFMYMKELQVLAAEGLIALASFVLYKVKPKRIKYPNCFMMPVIAFAFMLLFSVYVYFSMGQYVREAYRESLKEQESSLEEPAEETDEGSDGSDNTAMNDYAKWLSEQNIETAEEIKEDMRKLKELEGEIHEQR